MSRIAPLSLCRLAGFSGSQTICGSAATGALTWNRQAQNSSSIQISPHPSTPPAANAYDALSSADKQHFRESDYRDYVRNVIEKNAMVLGSGKRYLEFAWCNGGIFAETSDQVAQRTDSNGWDYWWEAKGGYAVDLKFEQRIDAGFLFLSSGDKTSWEFKLQMLYAHKETVKQMRESTSTQSFGISGDLGIMRAGYLPGAHPGDPSDVTSYSFRVYLLRPSRQWTLEAALMGKNPQQGLNLTSRPWKVMYVVTDVCYVKSPSSGGLLPESRETEEEERVDA